MLITTLKKMRDLGNTILVVEHDEETMLESDYIVDIGPGAGAEGGTLVACGTPQEIIKCKQSITGKYLSGELSIPIPKKRRSGNGQKIVIKGAQANNLKNITVTFPLGKFICAIEDGVASLTSCVAGKLNTANNTTNTTNNNTNTANTQNNTTNAANTTNTTGAGNTTTTQNTIQ